MNRVLRERVATEQAAPQQPEKKRERKPRKFPGTFGVSAPGIGADEQRDMDQATEAAE